MPSHSKPVCTPRSRPSAATQDARARTGDAKKPRKRAHYLRHHQRCAIIERVSAGEQQAALAREYKVTRAAVSHIYRNREEILAREVEDESEDEEDDNSDYLDVTNAVIEIGGLVVLTLMTTLREARTDASSFCRAADRLINILLEESIATLGTRSVERVGAAGEPYVGLERQYELCAIALNAQALPFAAIFSEMEPNSPVGFIEPEGVLDGLGNVAQWRIQHMDVPANISSYKVLLCTFLCGDSGAECKAIEALQMIGIDERDIAIIAVQTSSRGIDMITNHYPHIRIITAVIDNHPGAALHELFPGLDAFLEHHDARVHEWRHEEEEKVENAWV